MNAEIHTLTGGYVLHALPDTERVAFERHLGECTACAQEVAELWETAARLGAGVAITPPQRLRAQVMAEVDRTRQQPPQVPATPVMSRARRRVVRVGSAIAAAAVVAAVVFGVQWTQAQQRLHDTRAQLAAIGSVLGAPDAATSHGTGTRGGHAMAVVSARQGAAVLLVSGLPPIPDNRVYQAWFISPNGARSAGMLHHAAADRMQPLIGTVPPGTQQVGVTIEPAGGSRQPSMDHMMLLFPLA